MSHTLVGPWELLIRGYHLIITRDDGRTPVVRYQEDPEIALQLGEALQAGAIAILRQIRDQNRAASDQLKLTKFSSQTLHSQKSHYERLADRYTEVLKKHGIEE